MTPARRMASTLSGRKTEKGRERMEKEIRGTPGDGPAIEEATTQRKGRNLYRSR